VLKLIINAATSPKFIGGNSPQNPPQKFQKGEFPPKKNPKRGISPPKKSKKGNFPPKKSQKGENPSKKGIIVYFLSDSQEKYVLITLKSI
jgi:hypothetical protein